GTCKRPRTAWSTTTPPRRGSICSASAAAPYRIPSRLAGPACSPSSDNENGSCIMGAERKTPAALRPSDEVSTMRSRLVLAVGVIAFWLGALREAEGAAVVVANRTRHDIRFTVTAPPDKARAYTLSPADLVALRVAGPVDLTFDAGKAPRHYTLT